MAESSYQEELEQKATRAILVRAIYRWESAVIIGLTGSSRLVYDLWGDTVDGAHFLARAAFSGQILVAESTKALIPAEEAIAPWVGATTDVTAWEIDPLPAAPEPSS